MEPIRYGRQYIDDDDINAVIQVLKSDYLTQGPALDVFEQKFKEYTGAKYAVAVANGTAALHAAVYAAGITSGDEVITTPMTFAASANAILYCGGTPVFADIDAHTYNISPDDIRRKITSKTKAILVVHYTGQPCAMDEINDIAAEYHLTVIEDAAHALGAKYKGKTIGSESTLATFSFHPLKHITTAEGGMIATNDPKLYERLILFRSHGITRNPALLKNNSQDDSQGAWYYEQLELGYNYRLTELSAALGISQLNKIDAFLERRRQIVKMYDTAFEGDKNITIPYQHPDCRNAWHLYVIQVDAAKRAQTFSYLRESNIIVNVNYIPVYTHPYYRENGYSNTCCPVTEQLYSRIISIPMHYGLTDDMVHYVIDKVKESAAL